MQVRMGALCIFPQRFENYVGPTLLFEKFARQFLELLLWQEQKIRRCDRSLHCRSCTLTISKLVFGPKFTKSAAEACYEIEVRNYSANCCAAVL